MTRQAIARRVLGMVDLTSLNDDDTPERIAALCEQALTPAGNVAAVCIYTPFVRGAAEALRGSGVRVATVVNFPDGGSDVAAVTQEVTVAVESGADEIDVVLPYARYAAGAHAEALEIVRATRDASAGALVKVILETGRLGDPDLIHSAAADALEAGADFVKTSTGKLVPGATLDAAQAMLEAIAACGHGGFKAAGGVRTTEEAGAYLALADTILGPEWASPQTFRFGASSLLGDLLSALGDSESAAPGNGTY